MAVALLVGADRHFRDVGVHGAVGQHEHDVGAAGAAVAPGLQFDGGEVRDEIGLPHVVAGAHGDEIALAGEILVFARAGGELMGRLEHEAGIVERVHHQRQVGGGDDSGALAPRAVEMPVLGIQGNREQAARAPFEALSSSVGKFDLGRAGALQHVDHVLVKVALRGGGAAGRNIEHEHICKIAAARQMHGGGRHPGARPQRGLDRKQVDGDIVGDLEPFGRDPVQIGIDAVAGFLLGHGVPRSFAAGPVPLHVGRNKRSALRRFMLTAPSVAPSALRLAAQCAALIAPYALS